MSDAPIHVLLVEDNPGDARLIQEAFKDARHGSFQVAWRETLAEGFSELEEGAVDVVLLDLSLPDSHGLDTLVKATEHAPGVPIVVLTGLDDEENALAAVKQGAQDYLVKGHVDSPGLSRAVRYAIERKEAATELSRLRRQVAMSEKLSALGALVSGLAQQIRGATTDITNTLYQVRQRVEEEARKDPELTELVEDVGDLSVSAMEALSTIDRIVRDLRTFTSTGPEARERVGLQEPVREAVDLFRRANPSSLQVVADLQATDPIELNPAQIQQITLALLTNAAEAMPKGGNVRVTTRSSKDAVELLVADEGEGISPYTARRMFEPFFTTKDQAGLGLPIVQRIADAHEGTVDYETEEGRGTTVIVRFPRTTDQQG